MIYGLYLSAAGVMSSSYRQDVTANNLANAENVGFKRDLPLFQERLTEAQQRRGERWSDPLMEGLGGGLLASPTVVDNQPGDLESTGSPLDVAIQGDGFFAVRTSFASTAKDAIAFTNSIQNRSAPSTRGSSSTVCSGPNR